MQYSDASRVSTSAENTPSGEFVIGKWFEGALGQIAFAEDLIGLAEQLRPVFDSLEVLAGGGTPAPVNDDLDGLVQEFTAERGYPTEQDATFRSRREKWRKC